MNCVIAKRRKIPPTIGSFSDRGVEPDAARASSGTTGRPGSPAPPKAAARIRKLCRRKVAMPRTTTVRSGSSALKSAKNSVNRGMTKVIRIAISTTESAIRIDGIDERRDDLARQRDDGLLVLQVPAQHRLDLARLLARLERRPVEAREEVALLGEGLRDRGARVDPLAHVGQHPPQDRALLALEQDLEGAHDRKSRLQERDELLVEDQELGHLDAAAPASATSRPRGRTPCGGSRRRGRRGARPPGAPRRGRPPRRTARPPSRPASRP